MASSFPASFSTSSSSQSSSPASASFSPTPTLLHLPAVLLPHVCSFLSPRELLATLAQTSTLTRDSLTPACFSSLPLELGVRELKVLSSLPFSRTMRPFHSRALADTHLVQQVLGSLNHFPACRTLTVRARQPYEQGMYLHDPELHALLHHPTTLACSGLTLAGFIRHKTEQMPTEGEQEKADEQLTRAKRRRLCDVPSSQRAPFDWSHIRLPNLTRLRLTFHGKLRFTGGVAFLTANHALRELDVCTVFLSVAQLTAVLQDPVALPQLTRFTLRDTFGKKKIYDLAALVTALAATVVGVSGGPRPMEWLRLDAPTPRKVFAAVGLMTGLTHLRVERAEAGWLQEWPEGQELRAAVPLLRECVVHIDWNEPAVEEDGKEWAARDMLPFMQSMADRPLQRLDIHTGDGGTFTGAAIAQLARCHQLRQLHIATGFEEIEIDEALIWMDWTDAAALSSFTPKCLPQLRSLKLETVRLSAESVAAIASAAPQLRDMSLCAVELSCHPAVICAIVGGCCEHIEELSVGDRFRDFHVWSAVRAEDATAAYQAAVAAAARGDEYRPFTRLRLLHAEVCWCTPPSVWHALLSLLKHASRLQHVAKLASDDPLVVSALGYLPSITTLGTDCLWPLSFATFIEQRNEQTGRYRYLASHEVGGHKKSGEHLYERPFELTDRSKEGGDRYRQPVRLLPHSGLLSAFQRSLSSEQQSAVTRWASGDFRADDEELSAAESPPAASEQIRVAPGDRQPCPHPHEFYSRYQTKAAEDVKAMQGVSGCG